MSADLSSFPIQVQTIPELAAYGSPNLSIADGDLIEITKNSGTVGSPLYIAGASAKITVGQLRQLLGIGVEVTDNTKRTALKLNSNWINPLSTGDSYYGIMTVNIVSGQNEHDYYIGYDSFTNTLYRYSYEKVNGTLQWTRVASEFNTPTT